MFHGIVLPRHYALETVTASVWLERQYTTIVCGLRELVDSQPQGFIFEVNLHSMHGAGGPTRSFSKYLTVPKYWTQVGAIQRMTI